MATQTAQEVINALGAISNGRVIYLAMEQDYRWYAYPFKPRIGNSRWNADDRANTFIGPFCFPCFNIQPAENWKESLVEYQPNPEIKIQEYGNKI